MEKARAGENGVDPTDKEALSASSTANDGGISADETENEKRLLVLLNEEILEEIFRHLTSEELEDIKGVNPLWIETVRRLRRNDQILENILTHGSFQDLKNFRFVNFRWDKVVTRLMEPVCKPIFFRRQFIDGLTLADMRRLCDILLTSRTFPCREFLVNTNFCHAEPREQEKQAALYFFFQAVAPLVKKLELGDKREVRNYLGPPPPDVQYPRLHTLSLTLQGRPTDFPNGLLYFAGNMVKNAPQLQELNIEISFQPHHHFLPYPIALPASYSQLQKVTLTLSDSVQDSHLDQILELGITPLTELSLIMYSPISAEAIQRFLHFHQETLVSLDASHYMEAAGKPLYLQLPALPQLRHLFWDCGQKQGMITQMIVSLVQSFPLLQDLYLMRQSTSGLATFFNENIAPMPAVEELTLHDSIQDPGVIPVVPQVARILPNLRKLTIQTKEDWLTVRHLEALENLEELVLGPTRLDNVINGDGFLTGYSPKTIEHLRALSEGALVALSQRTTGAPLPFLKHLKTLRFYGNQVSLSDVACRLVLLKLPNFNHLDIKWVTLEPPGISPPVLAEMQTKFTIDAPLF